MKIENVQIVLFDKVIPNGTLIIEDGKIIDIIENKDLKEADKIVMPGFIDLHVHGSLGIDFMDAKASDYEAISNAFYSEGITSYLATTLTSDNESLKEVCRQVKVAKESNPSLLGIHLEGPYISVKYKGAQNEAYVRNPDFNELKELYELSGGNIRYISMAPEKEGSMEFIKKATELGVTVSAGHTDATFAQVEEAIKNGLTNTTHTHNAMSPHHHRNPGVVTAALACDELYTECICDLIHVCKDTIKAFYKIVGPERFMIITDALKAKHSDLENFQLFGLDCVRKDGAAYLTSGPLAGSLLNFDQGLRNIKEVTNCSLVDLARISSYNQAKSLKVNNIGEIKVGYNADLVVLDSSLHVQEVFKNGKKVF